MFVLFKTHSKVMKENNTKQTELTIGEIRRRMHDGDYPLIAFITGYSTDYVCKCMNEKRNNRIIKRVAEALICNRDQFAKDMKKLADLVREEKGKGAAA